MNTIISNMQFLNDNDIDVEYSAYGDTQSEFIKIACGVIKINPRGARTSKREVSFGGLFTPGTRPVVVVSLATDNVGAFAKVEGPGAADGVGNSVPTSEGFKVVAVHPDSGGKLYAVDMYAHWVAIGY